MGASRRIWATSVMMIAATAICGRAALAAEPTTRLTRMPAPPATIELFFEKFPELKPHVIWIDADGKHLAYDE